MKSPDGGSTGGWDAGLYDRRTGFVSRLGRGVVDLLDPQDGERILDLGCGTGDLAWEISRSGATVLGIDASPGMVEQAARKYPSLDFAVEDATTFRSSWHFDAVFSNAALHWIRDAGAAVESVRLVLRPGGRFVAELGGRGNVAAVVAAVTEALAERGISAAGRDPWYFPSLSEYAGLLERSGFRVVHAEHFDRPTPLEGGEAGILHWLETFGGAFFRGLSGEERRLVLDRVVEKSRPALYREDTWTVDYVRLRVAAVKE